MCLWNVYFLTSSNDSDVKKFYYLKIALLVIVWPTFLFKYLFNDLERNTEKNIMYAKNMAVTLN